MNNPFAKKLELEYCGCDCHMMCIGGTEPPLGGHCSNCMESDHTPAAFSPPTTQGDTNLAQPKGSGEQLTSVDLAQKLALHFNTMWGETDRRAVGMYVMQLMEYIAEERRQAKIQELESIPEFVNADLYQGHINGRLLQLETDLRGENTSE